MTTQPDQIQALRDALALASSNLVKLEAAARRQCEIRDAAEAEAVKLKAEHIEAATAATVEGKPAPKPPAALTAAKDRAADAVDILANLDQQIEAAINANDLACDHIEMALAKNVIDEKREILAAQCAAIVAAFEIALRECGPRALEWLHSFARYCPIPRHDPFAAIREEISPFASRRRKYPSSTSSQLIEMRDASPRWSGALEGEAAAMALLERLPKI